MKTLETVVTHSMKTLNRLNHFAALDDSHLFYSDQGIPFLPRKFSKCTFYVYFSGTFILLLQTNTHHSPIVSQSLLFDREIGLLVEQLFDILNRCEGRDLVGP